MILSLVFIFAVIVPLGILTPRIVQSVFRLSPDTDFLLFTSTAITIGLLIIVTPGALFTEAVYAKWRKRKLRLTNFLIMTTIMAEGIVVVNAFSFIVQFLLPGLSFTNEPFVGLAGLILGLMIGLPVLIIALTSRIPRLRSYLKAMF